MKIYFVNTRCLGITRGFNLFNKYDSFKSEKLMVFLIHLLSKILLIFFRSNFPSGTILFRRHYGDD